MKCPEVAWAGLKWVRVAKASLKLVVQLQMTLAPDPPTTLPSVCWDYRLIPQGSVHVMLEDKLRAS